MASCARPSVCLRRSMHTQSVTALQAAALLTFSPTMFVVFVHNVLGAARVSVGSETHCPLQQTSPWQPASHLLEMRLAMPLDKQSCGDGVVVDQTSLARSRIQGWSYSAIRARV
ncbi:hypothetical protein BDQ94DRAFT_141438 [Aspergillus welwitschiae]|uniref:Uncharacterized protein n=1 Tax=Aspergillus welwitschiae TaxID=1341132 RepID=A0A3F3Q6P3_9EURO|nr:hypothetical protein BDQ94DRAFT_141438 [Aspergillus welwitschiae]RDH34416.1 hypothetical protein BDQ94DRAFT_141438 [Aspergillus welwitschiae]